CRFAKLSLDLDHLLLHGVGELDAVDPIEVRVNPRALLEENARPGATEPPVEPPQLEDHVRARLEVLAARDRNHVVWSEKDQGERSALRLLLELLDQRPPLPGLVREHDRLDA